MFEGFKKEKGPEVRIVGGASEEAKEKVRQKIKGFVGESHLESLSKESRSQLEILEYPKSPEERKLINFANQKINDLIEKSGVSSHDDIPEKNIHIVPPDHYKKIDPRDAAAITFQKYQLVVLNALYVRDNLPAFGTMVFHELMHLKSHLALETEETEGEEQNAPKTTQFRGGLETMSAQKRDFHRHFEGLNEALIAFSEKSFSQEMMGLPMFRKELKWLNSPEALEIKKRIAGEKKVPEEDVIWVERDGNRWHGVAYPEQRKVFLFLASEIQKEFPEKYESVEEVRLEFLRSFFNGRLLAIAKLIDATFGRGSFEGLGMMESDDGSGIKALENLRRRRARHLHSKELKFGK